MLQPNNVHNLQCLNLKANVRITLTLATPKNLFNYTRLISDNAGLCQPILISLGRRLTARTDDRSDVPLEAVHGSIKHF